MTNKQKINEYHEVLMFLDFTGLAIQDSIKKEECCCDLIDDLEATYEYLDHNNYEYRFLVNE